MTGLIMHPRVVPVGRSIDDTIKVCGNVSKTYRYCHGQAEPHFPVPAIPLQVKYDYLGCVNIDDVTDPNDPVTVYFYDSWQGDRLGETL